MNTGKPGSLIIQAPEAIYQDSTHIKLSTDSETTIELTTGTINPKYKTEWIKEGTTIDTSKADNPKINIQLRGTTNTEVAVDEYISNVESTLTADKIKVLIDGEDITQKVTVAIGTATQTANTRTGAKDVLQTVTISKFPTEVVEGKDYKEWGGNITIEVAQGTLSDTKGPEFTVGPANNRVTKQITYGNKNMELAEDGTRKDNSVKDTTAVDKNTTNAMFADFIKPEFRYKASDTTIIHGQGERVEITFDVIDKYFGSTIFTKLSDNTYDASKITVGIDDYDKEELNNAITKTLTKVQDITGTVDGNEDTKIGERYKLTIRGLDAEGEDGIGNGYKYSGYMSLSFTAGAIKDKSENESNATTITIGKDEPDGSGNGTIVDVVDPVWSIYSANADDGTVRLRVKDKFLNKETSQFNLTREKIIVLVNGLESTAIVKTLSDPVEIVANEEYEYVLTLSNLAPADAGYTEFTPIEAIVGGTAKYKNENGGNISLKIQAGTVVDAYENASKEQVVYVGDIDATGPEVYDVQKTQDEENNKETVIFNVTDKNFDDSKSVTEDKLTVWMDGIQIDDKVTKTITSKKDIKTIVDGKEKVVGHQYTLELTSIVESDEEYIASGRDYRELSGTLEVKIDTSAASDMRGNPINEETTTLTGFVDMIKPETKYEYATSDINYQDKTFTMTFDMIDKYYDSTKSKTLTAKDLTIKVDGKDINTTNVTISLQSDDKTSTVNGTSKVIGKHYILTLSDLEQLQVKDGDNYLDYSGVITVGIPAEKMADTYGNKNIAKTITSGIDIPGGTASESGTIVDIVDPLWEKVNSDVNTHEKTAIFTIKGTDKYFANSTLKKENIKVFVDGEESNNATIELSDATDLKEERISGETTTTVKYGVLWLIML